MDEHAKTMRVEVAYAKPEAQVIIALDVQVGTTLEAPSR